MSRPSWVVSVIFLLVSAAMAGDSLSLDRKIMKAMLKNVASDVEKNFYDPKLKGLDWTQATEAARLRIENATTVNDMVAAIYELPEKLGDSHTVFVPPTSTIRPDYGFEVKMFGEDAYVYDVKPKGAAAKAGVQVGDQVLDIDDLPLKRASLDRTLLFKRVLFPMDPLYLNIRRGGQKMVIQVHPEIRKSAALKDRFRRYGDFWSLFLEAETYAEKHLRFQSGMKGRVGYLNIRLFPSEGTQFLSGLADQVKKAEAYVIDLRDTPGGSLDTLLSFLGMFEDSPLDLGSAIGRTKAEPVKIKPRKPRMKGRLVLLVDSNTASAAEVTARYLQKHHQAVVVGDATAGMATLARMYWGEVGAPNVIDFGIQVATDRLVLSDGEELEKKGVKPDVACLPTPQDLEAGKDPCLARALAVAENVSAQPSR